MRSQPPHPAARPPRGAVLAVVFAVAVVVAFFAGSLLGDHLARPSAAAIASFVPSPSAEAPSPTSVPQDIAVAALNRTVTVEVISDAAEQLGTAWLLDSNGDFVTNAHVVNGHLSVRLRERNGTGHVGVVVDTDASLDIALVRSTDGFPGPPLAVTQRTPEINEPVVAIASSRATGHDDVTLETVTGLGVTVHANAGEFSSTTSTIEYLDMIEMQGAQVFAGNSGGPILDSKGEVIGVLTLASTNLPTAYAIPMSRIATTLHDFATEPTPAQ